MTKKELDQECKNIIIIIDSQEKKIDHITDIFDRCNISYVVQNLDFGDYSFIARSTGESFEKDITIERKNGLSELSQNFSKYRARFINELERSKLCNAKMSLMIERDDFLDLLEGNYDSDFRVKSYIASLMTFKFRYNLDFCFIDADCSANYIYNSFKYYYREILKKELKSRVS